MGEWVRHVFKQQHNHFLGIPCASQEPGCRTERPSVCWRRRRRAGNQDDMLFTVCVTRRLSSKGPHLHSRARCCCWACCVFGACVFLLDNLALQTTLYTHTHARQTVGLSFARLVRKSSVKLLLFCVVVAVVLFLPDFKWKLFEQSGSHASLPLG